MTSIHKFAGYGAAVTAAFAVAILLLVSSGASTAQAAAGTAVLTKATMPADSTNTLTITDAADIGAATDFAVVSINGVSAGTAKFTSGGGQSLVVFNGGTGDTDAAVNTTIVIGITGTGGSGAVVINVSVTDGVDGLDGVAPDGEQTTVAYTQTAVAGQIQLFATVTGIPTTAVAGTATSQTVLSAKVTTSTGAGVTPGTTVTFQAVGVGVFQDTVTAASVVAAGAGGGVYGAGAAGESGCSAGEGLQSCTAATETLDDGEVIATSEPAASGVASVTFEGAGVAGQTVITAKVGTTLSASVTINVFGAATTIASARTGTGATLAAKEFIRNNGADTANIVVTVTDAAGVAVSGHIPTFVVTAPGPTAGPVTLAGAANGTIPSCAAGTNTGGRCNILVTASTTLGVNNIRIRAAGSTTIETNITVEVVGAAANVAFDAATPTSVDPLSTTKITINVTDAAGRPAPDTTAVTVLATGTGVITAVSTTSAGVSTATLVAGNTDGAIQVIATVGTLTVQKTITVGAGGGTTPPPAGAIALGGGATALVVGQNPGTFGPGTVEGLQAATLSLGGQSAVIFITGKAVTVPANAPAVVISALGIPAGFFNQVQIIIVVKLS